MPGAIDLAHVSLFKIGDLRVEPSSRSIRGNDDEVIAEPRVLQLLVAFSHARGRVLSRDDLVQRVWGGRVVGENAIHRAVSRLRTIAATTGRNSFSIETVKGVGYKLVERDARKSKLVPALPSVGRRAVLAGGGAAVLASTALLYGALPTVNGQPGGLSVDLFDRAEVARRDEESRVTAKHAIALYRQSLRLEPTVAEAWGGLALAYVQLANFEPDSRVTGSATLSIAAAKKALEIDDSQQQARLALLAAAPAFGRWDRRIAQLAELNESRNAEWAVPAELGRRLADTGRFNEGIATLRLALDLQPLLPRVLASLFHFLWSTGSLVEAENLLDEAVEIWPRRWLLWNAKFRYLALAGRTAEAESFLRNETYLPTYLSSDAVSKRLMALRVLSGEDGSARAGLIDSYFEDCRESCNAVPNASMMLSALGATDALFEVLDGYYFAVGSVARQLNAYSRRRTAFLYMPPFDRVRDDARFRSLMDRIGLPGRIP